MMKFTVLLLALSISSASAGVKAQQIISDFRMNDATLLEVLKAIESQSGYTCLYSLEDVAGVKNLTFEFTDTPVTQILERCLRGTQLEYVIVDETIVIRSKHKTAQQPERRERVITGTVKDPYTLPIPGATIVLKGTIRGTSTDRDGRFTLTVPESDEIVLSVSFIGKKSQEVRVETDSPLTVVLEEEQTQIDQVVVMGMFTREATALPVL